MRKSKYLNKTFGNWTCTHVGVAVKTGAFKKGTRIRNAYPHHQTYYYIFERETSDGLAEKLVRLNEREAAKVYRGELSVEEVADLRQSAGVNSFTAKVSYHFVGK
jgi:hypothetical protein